jgi:ABC-type glycerol-3-phosphate transport system substrate-binding protein
MLSRVRKGLALGLSIVLLTAAIPSAARIAEAADSSTVVGSSIAAESSSAAVVSSDGTYVSESLSRNYTKVSAGYTAPSYTGAPVTFEAAEVVEDMGEAQLTQDTYDYQGADQVLNLELTDKVTLSVDVPETALYQMSLSYLSYDESVLPMSLAMKVDGDYPFYECRSLKLESTWVSPEEKTYDRYGDEIVAMPNKLVRWEEKYVMDGSYRYAVPLLLELTAGTHQLEFTVKEGNFLLGSIRLEAPSVVPAYEGSQPAPGESLITIQAEDFSYRNDSAIHGIAEYDTSLSPYEVTDTILNTIDSDSFYTAGQTVSYEVTIGAAGYYDIGLNYRQSDKSDFPVFVDVKINGQLPNTQFQSYPLDFHSNYKQITLEDEEGTPLSVWLDKGLNTISFTITNEEIRHVLEGLDEVMAGVNDLALEITKVAGTNADKYRDLKLTRYIPNIEETLYGYVDQLYELQDSVMKYSGGKDSVAVLSSMIVAAEQIRSLAKEPDEIPYRVGELSSSVNSANHHLANTVDNLLENSLAIDRIYIYQEDANLPKKPNIITAAGLNINRFVTSFTDQAYSTNNTDPSHLQVWVNRSSQFVQVMQKMIDETFTPQTGIEVDISIMPDQRKLVLSNTSGNSPDVATGINYTIPYELAIRGALADMQQFDDFRETAEPYEAGLFLTSTINGGIYAMPETMNFWVLFYRSDILDKLGLKVPDTMEDVVDMLPELQMRGLNYYQPVSGMLTMRNFHGTTPLIHQFGGTLYGETAQEGTTLGSPASIDGFTYLTDLFTLYDLPINIDNFYQHLRNGDIPIGVADFLTYNLMTNAAPELKDSWDIALVPGIKQADGTVDRTICGCAESSVIFKSNADREQQAWEFIKWWSSAQTQAQYGQTMQMVYGSDYMWATANRDAFMELPWPSEDKMVIREQMSHVIDIARVPGTYLLEREMSNAFNDIVVNGDTAQTRIDEAVKVTNREFNRKLEEFGFIDSNGDTIEPYQVPSLDSVKALLGREE